ncbi:hypothetical protein D3C81_2266720 [compost metagenome]
MEFLNKDNGNTGLLALRSIRIRIIRPRMEAPNKPRISGEPQSYFVPAHEKPSKSATMVRERKMEPK